MTATITLPENVEMKKTREGFGRALVDLGERDPRIVVLVGDLSESTMVHFFAERFPDRFIQVGIAEQNMCGIAAGLAATGKIPFFSTYGAFASCRAADQIRVTVAYSNLNVKIGGAHGGISVGPDGATHQAMEEISIIRSIPNMSMIVPCDYWHFSIGHVTPVIYSLMAERGYFPLRDLMKFRAFDGHAQGHPSAHDTPGIEVSAGSLGQGLSVCCGVAMASRIDHHPRRIYCVMGDGEQQEGQIWEAAMFAAHYRLDHLCGIIDYNHKQIDGDVEDIMGIKPLAEKWRSFNWNVIECRGHDIPDVLRAFAVARAHSGWNPSRKACISARSSGTRRRWACGSDSMYGLRASSSP